MTGSSSPAILVDADGCPVKREIVRVALRHSLRVTLVANTRMRVPEGAGVELVIVGGRFDAADDWIVEHVREDDIVVTGDIPLASRCLPKGARVIDHRGGAFSPESIGGALASRELMSHLRDMGTLTGGPAAFQGKDKSRFLHRLDETIVAVLRGR